MRQIKFRAWDSEQKKMITTFDGGYKIYVNEEDGTLFCGGNMSNGDWSEPKLMQYTGLNDINNNEIFECDIIEYTQHYFNTDMIQTKYKIVKWKYDKWGIYETNAGESDIKVIGNIYENPDLLQNIN